jgi:acyl-coenzyme A thioesterase PaaI-like protein
MSELKDNLPSAAEIIHQFLPTSPYVGHLGIQLVNIQPGTATLLLPFKDELITINTVVHGGLSLH